MKHIHVSFTINDGGFESGQSFVAELKDGRDINFMAKRLAKIFFANRINDNSFSIGDVAVREVPEGHYDVLKQYMFSFEKYYALVKLEGVSEDGTSSIHDCYLWTYSADLNDMAERYADTFNDGGGFECSVHEVIGLSNEAYQILVLEGIHQFGDGDWMFDLEEK